MWWLKRIMGAGNSSYLAELSDDDSSDSEFDYSLEPRPDKKMNNFVNLSPTQNVVVEEVSNVLETDHANKENTTDAAAQSFLNPNTVVNLDRVLEMEKNLDIYEVISLVYLLYDEPNYALQELMLYLQGAPKNLLYSWANLEESRSHNWQKKLVEALCVIKNYQILRTLGYKKQDLRDYYSPHLSTAITNLNKVRKATYLICEKLNCAKTEKLLSIVKFHFEEKGLTFMEYDAEFLELYFLKWETIGYITKTDMGNIKRAFKVMEEEALLDILESVLAASEKIERKNTKVVQNASSEDKTPKPRSQFTSTDTHQRASSSGAYSGDFKSLSPSIDQDNGPNFIESAVDKHRYKIDPENPGLLLIINQEEFYTEIDPQYKDLLPTEIERNKLESRSGTERDKEDLMNTFEMFGFKVTSADNLTHEELILKVKQAVKSVRNESSLFVCILSHGDKGVVYGANSCKVKVNQIQEIMCRTNKENLQGKPKILILQSCQGKQCQKILEEEEEEDNEDNSMTTDGPSNSKQPVPRTADMLTFWATVPGYAAIRNKRTGSWFIQALVKKMIELVNKHHFADICTRINANVTGQTWTVNKDEKNAMTPMVVSTLTKDFYLPPLRNIH